MNFYLRLWRNGRRARLSKNLSALMETLDV